MRQIADDAFASCGDSAPLFARAGTLGFTHMGRSLGTVPARSRTATGECWSRGRTRARAVGEHGVGDWCASLPAGAAAPACRRSRAGLRLEEVAHGGRHMLLVGPAWRPGGSHRAQPPGDDAPLSVGEAARRTCHADIGSRGPHMLWEA
jgi:hypothetical protein